MTGVKEGNNNLSYEREAQTREAEKSLARVSEETEISSNDRRQGTRSVQSRAPSRLAKEFREKGFVGYRGQKISVLVPIKSDICLLSIEYLRTILSEG